LCKSAENKSASLEGVPRGERLNWLEEDMPNKSQNGLLVDKPWQISLSVADTLAAQADLINRRY
jgi:hypothetical protein